jgi:hypothetical protein
VTEKAKKSITKPIDTTKPSGPGEMHLNTVRLDEARELSRTERLDFQPEAAYKIGDVTYRVSARFDDEAENLFLKIRRLLGQDVEKELLQNGHSQRQNL